MDKKEYYKEWRLKHPDYHKNYQRSKKYLEKKRIRDKGYRGKKRDFIINFKKDKSCKNCGYNKNPQILEFHHKEKKLFNLSDKHSAYLTLQEIRKCIMLCPNCHRELHSKHL